ncbi:MAG: enoyl-CoA hydratase-related protein [Acidimicrobiia bacterium]
MDFEQIELVVDEGLATVVLDRPESLNAVTERMAAELLAACDLIDADDGIRAVVLTGRGRAFCAGADLSVGDGRFDLSDTDAARQGEVPADLGGVVTLRLFELTKPLVAAVNGAAVGFGVTLTLPADVRIAATGARFGFVFTRRGIVPDACSSWFLPRLVGISRALRWCYGGELFDAAEALDGGLVAQVVDDPVAAAREVAAGFARSAPVAVAATRRMMWTMLGARDPLDAHRVDSRAMFVTGRSSDAYEGVAAFLEKRDPAFTGRVSELLDVAVPWEATRPAHGEDRPPVGDRLARFHAEPPPEGS